MAESAPQWAHPQLDAFDTQDPRQKLQMDEVIVSRAHVTAQHAADILQTYDETRLILTPLLEEIHTHGIQLPPEVLTVNEEQVKIAREKADDAKRERQGIRWQRKSHVEKMTGDLKESLTRHLGEEKLRELQASIDAMKPAWNEIMQMQELMRANPTDTYARLSNDFNHAQNRIVSLYPSVTTGAEKKVYRGTLRGYHENAKSPHIKLQTSLNPDKMITMLYQRPKDESVWEFTKSLLKFIIQKTSPPQLPLQQKRTNLLNIAQKEVELWQGWDEKVALSWKMVKEYLRFLDNMLTRLEYVHAQTGDELAALNRRLAQRLKDTERKILPPAATFDLGRFIREHYESFMQVFNETPLAEEITAYASEHNIAVQHHVDDSLIDEMYQEDPKKKDRSGKIHPAVFAEAQSRQRVLLRLVESISRERRSGQCVMLEGDEGNALETSSFSEALAQKLWGMERKWRSLSGENRNHWLRGEFGNIVAPLGSSTNVICLASEDYQRSRF